MTRFKLLRLKNAMLLANGVSNGIGVLVVGFLSARSPGLSDPEIVKLDNQISAFFLPLSFLVPVVLTILYEKPVRRFLYMTYSGESVPGGLLKEARRRLLNEPFFLIGLDFGIWLAAALLYSWIFFMQGVPRTHIMFTFFLSLYTGLITTTVAFFVLERVLQKKMVAHFFPSGGLYMTPKALRIRISTRLTALLFACNLIPFFTFLSTGHVMSRYGLEPAQAFDLLRSTVMTNAIIFMGVGIWLTILVSGNLRRPIEEIIRVLQNVRNGDFEQRVRVTSNDEIGYTGDVINEMNDGLKERDFIKETFGRYVTKEIRDEILSGNVPLDGELKQVTVLFSDLRNFTPMVESTPPKEVVRIINGYFREMERAINRYNGLVLQYIGDEIEAVFGAPIYCDDHPDMALNAAKEMSRRLRVVNEELQERGYPPLSHGIGIHTGEVVAANIGSPERLSYALVGDTVNTASRLQGLNKELGTEIILSASTRERLKSGYPLRALPAMEVKGKQGTVDIFTLDV
jgi:adenylate cyclase